MVDASQTIIDTILESGKITKEELDKKIEEKLNALGGLISKEGAAHIVANELNITVSQTPSSELKLKDIQVGMKNVNVLVKVLKKYEIRTFGDDGQGKVGSIFVGDETGFSRITFWNDKTDYMNGIQVGDILEIQHGYTKQNNDRIEIHMGNAAHCIVNPEGKTVTVPEREREPEVQKKLQDIKDDDTFVNITATIVQVYDPRFFESCPECNKRMKEENGEFICAEHGKQEPNYNYVMNIFLDDGTANIRATLWKEQIQKLLSLTHEEILKIKDNQEQLEEVKTDLLGRIISARARVKLNEAYNTKELVLYEVERSPEPEQDAASSKRDTAGGAQDAEIAKTSVESETQKGETADNKQNAEDGTLKPEAPIEERLDAGDEELPSIDDIGDDL